MNAPFKILTIALVTAPLLAACVYHQTPKTTPTAQYNARCIGDSYSGCYDEARDKCKDTLGYKVFVKKDNALGKEIMYSCVKSK